MSHHAFQLLRAVFEEKKKKWKWIDENVLGRVGIRPFKREAPPIPWCELEGITYEEAQRRERAGNSPLPV